MAEKILLLDKENKQLFPITKGVFVLDDDGTNSITNSANNTLTKAKEYTDESANNT
ncbi:MAG: hypothetical protein HUJ68_08670, partial [Clostridia bacterium]|nr:hypothetical protein [Clostridia bacterium]